MGKRRTSQGKYIKALKAHCIFCCSEKIVITKQSLADIVDFMNKRKSFLIFSFKEKLAGKQIVGLCGGLASLIAICLVK